jgi:hypothetical protein
MNSLVDLFVAMVWGEEREERHHQSRLLLLTLANCRLHRHPASADWTIDDLDIQLENGLITWSLRRGYKVVS